MKEKSCVDLEAPFYLQYMIGLCVSCRQNDADELITILFILFYMKHYNFFTSFIFI